MSAISVRFMYKREKIWCMFFWISFGYGSFAKLPPEIKEYILFEKVTSFNKFPWQKLIACSKLRIVCKEWNRIFETDKLLKKFSISLPCYALCKGNVSEIVNYYLPDDSPSLVWRENENDYPPFAYVVGSGSLEALKLFKAIYCWNKSSWINWDEFSAYNCSNQATKMDLFFKAPPNDSVSGLLEKETLLNQSMLDQEAKEALYELTRKRTPLFDAVYYENTFKSQEIFELHRFLVKWLLHMSIFGFIYSDDPPRDFLNWYKRVKTDHNAYSIDGTTHLIALITRHPERLELIDDLIVRGASVNKVDIRGKSPLYYAIIHKREQAIDLLLSQSSLDCSWVDPETGNSYLHYFVLLNLLGYIEKIIPRCDQSVLVCKNHEGKQYDDLQNCKF